MFNKLILKLILGLMCVISLKLQANELLPIDQMATGLEYREYIKNHQLETDFEVLKGKLNLDPIENAIKIGNRNLDWLISINKKRTADGKPILSLSNPKNMVGYPITSPKKNSPEIVRELTKNLLAETPNEIISVLNSDTEIPNNFSVEEDIYLKFALKYDRLYQSAIRWKLTLPYLDSYKARKQNDIRGYYFLVNQDNLLTKLQKFSELDRDTQKSFKINLTGLCFNTTNSMQECSQEIEKSILNQQVNEFYLKYKNKSETIYQSFFKLRNPRSEIKWSKSASSVMTVPFQDPQNASILSFLKINIEDEWKSTNWNLVIDFVPSADIHMVFEPNTTPHVNGIGGNTITMDEKAPLSEWDVQWTIRHEFGHVLGFPDCYMEFYDEQENVMINYQIDVTNLMCSRIGKFKSIHFDALKTAYLK